MLDGQEESGVVVFLVVLLHKVFRRGPTQGKEDKGPNGICPLGNGNKKRRREENSQLLLLFQRLLLQLFSTLFKGNDLGSHYVKIMEMVK